MLEVIRVVTFVKKRGYEWSYEEVSRVIYIFCLEHR